MNNSELKNPPCQQMLDDQGYLILRGQMPHYEGEVLGGADGGTNFSAVPGPLVVIGQATEEEWMDQAEKYTGVRPTIAAGYYRHFYKVVAE